MLLFYNRNDEMYTKLTTRRYITILFHQSSSAQNIAPWFNWLVWISTIIFVLWHLFYNDKIILVLYDIGIVYIVHQHILQNSTMYSITKYFDLIVSQQFGLFYFSYSLNNIFYGTEHYCIIILVNSHVSAEIHPPLLIFNQI